MSGLTFLKQLLLPGVKAAKGAERIPGKPGYYAINPSSAGSEVKAALRRGERRAMDEADMAERPGGGPVSMRGKENARAGHMLSGALNELRYAAEAGGSLGKPVKGVVVVDKGGNVVGGAAINKNKGREYLADPDELDFTAEFPNYLEYIATTTPDVKGRELMRQLQDLYGPDMVFQVANPKKNVSIYESWGASRMAPRIDGGDVLGGHAGLPAFRIVKPVEPAPVKSLEDYGQQRLPGFKGGGGVTNRPRKQQEYISVVDRPLERSSALDEVGRDSPLDPVDVLAFSPLALMRGLAGKVALGSGLMASGEAEAGIGMDKLLRLLRRQAYQKGYEQTPKEAIETLDRMRQLTPASFEVFRPEHLTAGALRSVPGSKSGERMIVTTPDQYLDLAAKLQPSRSTEGQIEQLRNMLASRESRPDYWNNDYYVDEFPKFRGFGDHPRLHFARTDSPAIADIIGHEGRHRMSAIGELYGGRTPLTIRAVGDYRGLDEALSRPWVMPEDSARVIKDRTDVGVFLRPMPRGLKTGGLVQMKEQYNG